jgi:hypothetical protein
MSGLTPGICASRWGNVRQLDRAHRGLTAAPAAGPDRLPVDERWSRKHAHTDERVQALEQQRLALDFRVPEACSFFLVAVDAFLGGVDVDERQRFLPGQQPRGPGSGR